ncbi:MAG TPA: CerR family C-terminal domain-containing protein [Bauldia sp.]|nr:CerR family C-terminal domain-containing protein [Bauldia sp.]
MTRKPKAAAPVRRAAERPAKRRPAGSPPASRQYRRARRDRGADTRAQLIDAALDVFGRLGFEGASTREIAKAAGANLAAIVYHFGGKEALYIAVAEHIAARIISHLGPTLAAVTAPEAIASPEAARAAMHRLLATFADVILGEAEAERWARFIVREQMQPTAAFDVIYGLTGQAVTNASRLMAAALESADDPDVWVRVFTMMGQVLMFRVAQAVVLRRMGWRAIGEKERAQIKRIVIQHLDAILDTAMDQGQSR